MATNAKDRILVKGGQWCVPKEDRPAHWMSLNIPDPFDVPAVLEPSPEEVASVVGEVATATEAVTSCPKCGAQIWPGSKSCRKCYEDPEVSDSDIQEWRDLLMGIGECIDDWCRTDPRHAEYRAAAQVMFSGVFTRDPKTIAKTTGLKVAAVQHWIGRLLETGTWTADGKVSIEEDNDDDLQFSIGLILVVGSLVGDFTRCNSN